MKYADMQKQLDSGRFEKRARNTTPPVRKSVRPREAEPDSPQLFDHLEAETWLANRLLQHGVDIYVGGPYERYADRLGAAIVRSGIQCVIVGRKDGKPESYASCFERVAGKRLPKKLNEDPRETPDTQHQTQQATP